MTEPDELQGKERARTILCLLHGQVRRVVPSPTAPYLASAM